MLFNDRISGIEIRCDVLSLGLGFGCSLFSCDGLCIDGLDGFIQIDSGCIGFIGRLLGCVCCRLCFVGGCLCGFNCGIHFGLHILNLLGKIFRSWRPIGWFVAFFPFYFSITKFSTSKIIASNTKIESCVICIYVFGFIRMFQTINGIFNCSIRGKQTFCKWIKDSNPTVIDRTLTMCNSSVTFSTCNISKFKFYLT